MFNRASWECGDPGRQQQNPVVFSDHHDITLPLFSHCTDTQWEAWLLIIIVPWTLLSSLGKAYCQDPASSLNSTPPSPVDIVPPSGVFSQLSNSWSLWKPDRVWRPQSPVAKVPLLSSPFPEQMWGSSNMRKGSLLGSSLSQKNGVEWSLAVNKSKQKPMPARDHWKKSANLWIILFIPEMIVWTFT